MIREGKAKLDIEAPDKISKELQVFYNPKMKLNRDISIEIIKLITKPKSVEPLRIALPLAGSGIRGIRFLLEAPEAINELYMNDMSRNAITKISDNLLLNNIYDYTKVILDRQSAQNFLFESKGFDYIDIDPFGTPNPFIDAAVQRISRDGILAITATDTAPLSGTYPNVCIRHYDGKPLRNELKHFVGLRILIRKIQLVAAQYEKALEPIFSYSIHHYFRIFFRCTKSKQKASDIVKEHKYLLYCPECQEYSFSEYNSWKCDCGSKTEFAGKLYSGKLWDNKLAKKIDLIKEIPQEASFEGKYYDIYKLSSSLKRSVPSFKNIKKAVETKKFKICRTHFSKDLVKTNMSAEELKNTLRDI
jgi:tRNA (guanine26-N2/guanine27-N2)-dimethyltransferase